MMPRGKISNPLALAVLALLLERPMHPYEMSRTLRSRRKEESIKLNYGSLYSVVESLRRHELIAARETVREGRRPERTVFELTPAGRAEFRDWMRELLRAPVKEYTQFEAALSLMDGLPPDDVADLLEQRAELLAEEIEALYSTWESDSAQGRPNLGRVESGYRAKMREAELEYVRWLIETIRSSKLDQ
jgi:DNA-binding PadR family transcriptional regulator